MFTSIPSFIRKPQPSLTAMIQRHGKNIEEFIDAKQTEEKKAWALIEQGYDGSYNGDGLRLGDVSE
jgi:hypothetical protein